MTEKTILPLSIHLRKAVLVLLGSTTLALSQPVDSSLSFFITSVGLGKGGNLGGILGADRHCQSLAQAVGAGNRTWRAYLSTYSTGGAPSINAKDRIGKGPWFNAKKVQVAADVADLHSPNNKLNKENSLTEKGDPVKGRGDSPNQHDILTGSHANGTAIEDMGTDFTCLNWTSDSTGKAMLGHHDRHGVASNIDSTSWNEAHASNGCSQANLVSTGGNGFFYCFAASAATTSLDKAHRTPKMESPKRQSNRTVLGKWKARQLSAAGRLREEKLKAATLPD
jgi:hypothetical protein